EGHCLPGLAARPRRGDRCKSWRGEGLADGRRPGGWIAGLPPGGRNASHPAAGSERVSPREIRFSFGGLVRRTRDEGRRRLNGSPEPAGPPVEQSLIGRTAVPEPRGIPPTRVNRLRVLQGLPVQNQEYRAMRRLALTLRNLTPFAVLLGA